MSLPLPVIANLNSATFECSYGRGCDGVCCREGEPPVGPPEIARLSEHLPRILPHLRPEARTHIQQHGILGELHDCGDPKLAVAAEWCVFFNQGCVLHKLGAIEGDPYRYKPEACALFPLENDGDGHWHVRQWGVGDEQWDLFCLNPAHSAKRAAESLQSEIRLLGERYGEPSVLPLPPPGLARESA